MKLLAGEPEPSGVPENGLDGALSVPGRGSTKEIWGFWKGVRVDVSSMLSIDERAANCPFTRGCICLVMVPGLRWIGVRSNRCDKRGVALVRGFVVLYFRSFRNFAGS